MLVQSWTHASDQELVNALLNGGNEQAFRELYQRYTPRLYRIVANVLDNYDHEAEDVVQETWLRAAVALRTFRWGSSLPTWLSAIAINRAREVLRGRKRWGTGSPADEPATLQPSISDQIDLERAVSQLPAGYRSVYELFDVEGYSHEEIAQRLGIAPGTSKSQLFHARRSLRAFLEPTFAASVA
ncbi:MAG TPA: sigma-70 family RNA polymerase sigma factor [Longimicrobiales bacterium]|nr:sigma-70 family RNA polymerase sigma factor [Longimicrobiales bacterium]